MPNLNKTGPMGKGSMTGRGMGICNRNTDADTNVNIVNGIGRGMGRGRRRGNGFGNQSRINEIVGDDNISATLKDISDKLTLINEKLADK